MEPVTNRKLLEFFEKLGGLLPNKVNFYLLGGSALNLLGNSRVTRDIDYFYELSEGDEAGFEQLVNRLAKEMKLDLEAVP